MAHVAFIGLGTMGEPMSRNLVAGGHTVSGFDLSRQALETLVANGGRAAASAADAVEGAEFVITMLPNASHVRSALFEADSGAQSAAAQMDKTAIFIEMSTIHPLESDGIRATLKEHGISMIDAPVGRTSMHAQSGQLLIMAGGSAEEIARAQPVFACLGDTVTDCGGPGMGIRIKMINNYMSIALNALTAEALTLAGAIGLDVNLAREVMGGTAAGQGHMNTTYPTKVLAGDLSPAFMVDLAHKDIGLALDLGGAVNVPMAIGAAAREMYTMARANGRGKEDWTALYAMMREIAGTSK